MLTSSSCSSTLPVSTFKRSWLVTVAVTGTMPRAPDQVQVMITVSLSTIFKVSTFVAYSERLSWFQVLFLYLSRPWNVPRRFSCMKIQVASHKVLRIHDLVLCPQRYQHAHRERHVWGEDLNGPLAVLLQIASKGAYTLLHCRATVTLEIIAVCFGQVLDGPIS